MDSDGVSRTPMSLQLTIALRIIEDKVKNIPDGNLIELKTLLGEEQERRKPPSKIAPRVVIYHNQLYLQPHMM